jgi:hypothetical protein
MATVGPWIALSSLSGLTASNTLYVCSFAPEVTTRGRAEVALALLTSDVQGQFQRLARRYADGLTKFEPGDFANLIVPAQNGRPGVVTRYKLAVQALLGNKPGQAHQLADDWFRNSKSIGSSDLRSTA